MNSIHTKLISLIIKD